MGKYMRDIALDKREYHRILINAILNRYRDPNEARQLINKLMEDSITTHMSLKQSLKKNKEHCK